MNVVRWMEARPHHRTGVRALQICVGLMVLLRLVTETPFAPYLWGPRGIGVDTFDHSLWGLSARALRFAFANDAGVYALLLTCGAAAIAWINGRGTRVAALALLICFGALNERSSFLTDGGDVLATLVFLYSLLLLPPRRKTAGRALVWLHNLGLVALGIQLAIVYTMSGLWKAGGEMWMEGTALYSISQVEEFSLPALRGLFAVPAIVTPLTWLAVLFQIWFPVAMLSRLRVSWLAVAICFHIGIGAFMGLTSFSLVMIGLDLSLINDHEYARASARIREWASTARSAGERLVAAALPRPHRDR